MAARETHARTALIIDDSRVTIHMLEDAFTVLGYRTVPFTSPAEGLAWLERNSPELALLDVNMPGISGLTLLEHLRDGGVSFPIVLITAQPSEQIDRRAAELGATDVLAKPISVDTLQGVVEHVARLRKSQPPEPEPEQQSPYVDPVCESALPPVTAATATPQCPPSGDDYLVRVDLAVQAARRWVERCDGYRRAGPTDGSPAELAEMLHGCVVAECELVARLVELSDS